MSAGTQAEFMPLDEFGKKAVEKYVESVTEYNGLVATIKAASGSFDDVLAAVMQDSSNPAIEKFLDAIEKHKAALQKLEHDLQATAEPIAKERHGAGSTNVEAETEKADALHKRIRSARTYILDSYGPEVLESTPEIARRTNRAAGTGGGGKRIRGFDVYVDGTLAVMRDAKGVERSNFAAAAKAAEVQTVDLQKAFYAAAGSEDKDKWPNRVEFEFGGKQIAAVRLTEDETPPKE